MKIYILLGYDVERGNSWIVDVFKEKNEALSRKLIEQIKCKKECFLYDFEVEEHIVK